jgi:hypothetical protein
MGYNIANLGKIWLLIRILLAIVMRIFTIFQLHRGERLLPSTEGAVRVAATQTNTYRTRLRYGGSNIVLHLII